MTIRRTGHIRERSPGSFELRYSVGTDPATGKRKVATTTVKGGRKDAEKELRRLLRTIDTGEHVDPNRILMRHWFAQWLDAIRPEVSPVTHERYTEFVDHYLAPAFGNMLLSKIRGMSRSLLNFNRASVAGMEVTRPWNSPQPGFPG